MGHRLPTVTVAAIQEGESGVTSEGGATPIRRTPVEPPAPAGHGGASSSDLEQAIGVLRARVEEEFRVAERLDSKQRQAFALAAGFFAVVQTVAFGSFQDVGTPGRVLLGIVALAAGLAVLVTGRRLTDGEELQPEDDVSSEALVRWCNEADGPDYVAVRIVSRLSTVARNRHESNKARALRVDAVQNATRWALILAGVELVFAVLFRI